MNRKKILILFSLMTIGLVGCGKKDVSQEDLSNINMEIVSYESSADTGENAEEASNIDSEAEAVLNEVVESDTPLESFHFTMNGHDTQMVQFTLDTSYIRNYEENISLDATYNVTDKTHFSAHVVSTRKEKFNSGYTTYEYDEYVLFNGDSGLVYEHIIYSNDEGTEDTGWVKYEITPGPDDGSAPTFERITPYGDTLSLLAVASKDGGIYTLNGEFTDFSMVPLSQYMINSKYKEITDVPINITYKIDSKTHIPTEYNYNLKEKLSVGLDNQDVFQGWAVKKFIMDEFEANLDNINTAETVTIPEDVEKNAKLIEYDDSAAEEGNENDNAETTEE